jgi:hypothetical protein
MAKSELRERNLVIDEWDQWAKNNIRAGQRANELKALAFYGYLTSEKPGLLEFKFAGDKWQVVKIWLRHAGRIAD